MAHVVYWDKSLTPSPNALHVTQFSHAFFTTLRNKSATVPEVIRAHCICVSIPHRAYSTTVKLLLNQVSWSLFSKVFMLVSQAFALAMHSGHAHCGSNPGPGLRPSWLPELVSDFEPLLPSIDSVPLPGRSLLEYSVYVSLCQFNATCFKHGDCVNRVAHML